MLDNKDYPAGRLFVELEGETVVNIAKVNTRGMDTYDNVVRIMFTNGKMLHIGWMEGKGMVVMEKWKEVSDQ